MRISLLLSTPVAISLIAATPAATIELNPLSAIKGAVEAVAEDRSSSDIAKDTSVKAKITAAITDKMGTDVTSIGIDVYEQNIMLTGTLKTAEQKAEAGKLVKTIEGVKTVHNEIRVVKEGETKKGAAEGFVDDSVIESKINAFLLEAKGVNVTNFRWRSVGGHVYLFGRALTKAELDQAIAVVKGIKNVLSITSRVAIRAK
jgi:hyperosmotically inducible protein